MLFRLFFICLVQTTKIDRTHKNIHMHRQKLRTKALHVSSEITIQGRIEPPGCLALARWAGWSAGQVGRHVKCWRREWNGEGEPGPLAIGRVDSTWIFVQGSPSY